MLKACQKDPSLDPVLTIHGTPYDLVIPNGLPPIEVPEDNPLTEEGVKLGRYLFYDPKIKCQKCHDFNKAFTIDQNIAVEVNGKTYLRNPMTLFNLAWVDNFAWDGRKTGMENKISESITKSVGISFDTLIPYLANKSDSIVDYSVLFKDAFDSDSITEDEIVKALSQFLRINIVAETRVQKYMNGDDNALNSSEKAGLDLFISETANCFHCHTAVNKLFTDNSMQNNGIDSVAYVTDFADWGFGEVTGNTYDNGKFRSVSLVNIALTSPYMHDGRFATLEEVVEHYNTGAKYSPNVSNAIIENGLGGLNLSSVQKLDLVAFLKALTDSTFMTDPKFIDPFQ